MTATELQRVARRLSNSTWCRHWLHWNYPQTKPWIMAINCRNADGSIADVYAGDMERAGFRREEVEGEEYWMAERTNDDGTPYEL